MYEGAATLTVHSILQFVHVVAVLDERVLNVLLKLPFYKIRQITIGGMYHNIDYSEEFTCLSSVSLSTPPVQHHEQDLIQQQ